MNHVTTLCLLGSLGVFCRYFLDQKLSSLNTSLPTSTLIINFLGSLFASFLYFYFKEKFSQEMLISSLLIGFCGGFTTFSTYSLQSFQFIQEGRWSLFLLYWAGSPLLCLLGVALPYFLFHKAV